MLGMCIRRRLLATRLYLFGSLATMWDTGIGMLVLIAALLPWLVPAGVVVIAARWLIRRRR